MDSGPSSSHVSVPRPPALALSRTFVTTLTLHWPLDGLASSSNHITSHYAPGLRTAEAAAQHPLVFFLGPSRPWVHSWRPSSSPMSCPVQYIRSTKCPKETRTQASAPVRIKWRLMLLQVVLPINSVDDEGKVLRYTNSQADKALINMAKQHTLSRS
jgi:hypothetical protein